MLCPQCKNVNLAMTDRQGIEIDYCPQCRGIWLDRGELDRLIERSERVGPPAAPIATTPASREFALNRGDRPHYEQRPDGGYEHRHDIRHDNRHDHRHKRPKSLLGELFDF